MNDNMNNLPDGGRYPYNVPGYDLPENAPVQKQKSPSRILFRLALFDGGALLLLLLVSWLFGYVLRSTSLAELYKNNLEASYLIDIMYTVFCIGLPFFILYLVLNKQKAFTFSLPLGGVYSGYNAFLLVFVGLGICLLGSVITNYLAMWADEIGYGFTSFYEALEGEPTPTTAPGVILMVVATAVSPALLEEFAFRGVLMQPLRKFGDWFAILTSALLFALMHQNMTQAPFALIAGVALGYCAVATGSLWTGILVHLLNNLLSVALALLENAYEASEVMIISDAAVYGFIGVGLLALIIFALRSPAFLRLRPGKYRNAKKYVYYLSPTVIIAVCVLLWVVLQDIQYG